MGAKFYRMFTGELDGELVLSHMCFRAWEARESVAELFHPLDYSKKGYRTRWREARKAGWSIVPVSITKYTGGKPRRRPDTYVGIDIANRGTE